MKTLKEVLKEYPEYSKLINAVIRRVGISSVKDINRHGIQGGYNGFIYHADTIKFAKTYRKEIFKLLKEDTYQLWLETSDIPNIVAEFNYFKNAKMDDNDFMNLAGYIVLGKTTDEKIPHLMAWYAAEAVCRWFED